MSLAGHGSEIITESLDSPEVVFCLFVSIYLMFLKDLLCVWVFLAACIYVHTLLCVCLMLLKIDQANSQNVFTRYDTKT